MESTLYLAVCIAGGIFMLVVSITSWLAILAIRQILSEVIESGAIPAVLIRRAHKDAEEMLRAGVIYDRNKFNSTCLILSGSNSDETALLSKLKVLLEENEHGH